MGNRAKEVIRQFTRDRGNLIPVLQKVQEAEGYLSPEAVAEISRFLDISENDIYSVASFYAQFRFVRPGEHTIKICLGTACHVRGGERILESVERELDVQCGGTTDDFKFNLERVACFGCCALAPVMVVGQEIYSKMTSARVEEILKQYE